MLKLRDDLDLKELEKFDIYPEYECDSRTGEVRIESFVAHTGRLEHLIFKRDKRKLARLWHRRR